MIEKRNTTYKVATTTPIALQALSAALGMMAKGGPGTGQLGAGGQLLDRLAAATVAMGAEAVAAYLRPLFEEHDRRWEESRKQAEQQ